MSALLELPFPQAAMPRHAARIRLLAFWAVMAGLAIAGTLIVLLIAGLLVRESWPLISQAGPLRFLTDAGWWPRDGSFNMSPMILASLLLTAGALAIATPLSLVFATFTCFVAPAWLTKGLRLLVEASAAVPTVVYGLWGITVIVPLVNRISPPGSSLLAGMIVVAVMIFPTIAMLSRAALLAVPPGYVQAAAALGVSNAQTVLRIVLPAARHGIVSAMILGAARAIGETMVVLMVCGNIVQVPKSLFEPVRTLTANIALEMPYAMGDHRASLFVAGLMMLVLVSALVALGEWVGATGRRGAP
ncbi:phosphate ABC transporter permease subunit PstC [Chitiniphilus purpureus]|uniref:Phosphate transport system permease protein n=1 Tax=Chitiniphilus purpureus TaxID=2981137 RepID=A0ABY6DVK1_9NEIS|nr:phosphate ABC transporter permease subunit PstC [Chitiniphilus sp. CD1]UXY15883.1 phosphate ABC transporter permease subunit PstC [Chitiniphilus sp. CD1]